jgi:Pyridoxamine 5'-phosphate oxidase
LYYNKGRDYVDDLLPQTERTTVRRLRQRGVYQRTVIHHILDEAVVCQVGFVVDGAPYVIPTIHARLGDQLYLHGAPANHMLGAARSGVEDLPLQVWAGVIPPRTVPEPPIPAPDLRFPVPVPAYATSYHR